MNNNNYNYIGIKTALENIYNVFKYIDIDKAKQYHNSDECIDNFSKELNIDNSKFQNLLSTSIKTSKEIDNYKKACWTIEYIDNKNTDHCGFWMQYISDDNNIFKKFKEKAQKEIDKLKNSSTQMSVKQELDQEIDQSEQNNEVKKPKIEEKKEDKKEPINDETENKESDKNKSKEEKESKDNSIKQEKDKEVQEEPKENKEKVQEDKESEEPVEQSSEQSEEENNSINEDNINNEENSDEVEEVWVDDLDNTDNHQVEEELPSIEEIESTIDDNKSSINDEIAQYINIDETILNDENELNEFIDIFYDKYVDSFVTKIKNFLEDSKSKPKWLKYFYYKNEINELKKKFNLNHNATEYVLEIGKRFIYNIFTTNTLLYNNAIRLLAQDIYQIHNINHNNDKNKNDEINKILNKYPKTNQYVIKSKSIDLVSSNNMEKQKEELLNRAIFIYKYIYEEGTLLDILELNELNKYYKEVHNKNKIIESSSFPYLPPVSYFLESMPKY